MRLETQEEYEAAKNSLTYLQGCFDLDEHRYFIGILTEAIMDWELVSKAQPNIDAFCEANNGDHLDMETAEKELAAIEDVLGSNHPKYIWAMAVHTRTAPVIALKSYIERLKTVYESGTQEWGWVYDYRCYLRQYHHVSWDTLEKIEDESLPEPDISRYESLQGVLDGLVESTPNPYIEWEGYQAHEIAIDKAMDDVIEEEGILNPREQRARKK